MGGAVLDESGLVGDGVGGGQVMVDGWWRWGGVDGGWVVPGWREGRDERVGGRRRRGWDAGGEGMMGGREMGGGGKGEMREVVLPLVGLVEGEVGGR